MYPSFYWTLRHFNSCSYIAEIVCSCSYSQFLTICSNLCLNFFRIGDYFQCLIKCPNYIIDITSETSKWLWGICVLSRAQLFITPWIIALYAPLAMGFSRQEYWSAFPFSSPGALLVPEIESMSPALLALAGRFFYHWATWETPKMTVVC